MRNIHTSDPVYGPEAALVFNHHYTDLYFSQCTIDEQQRKIVDTISKESLHMKLYKLQANHLFPMFFQYLVTVRVLLTPCYITAFLFFNKYLPTMHYLWL